MDHLDVEHLDAPKPALISALTTQHFALQSALAVATTEAGVRASIYMYSLSGALVAIGFADRPAHGYLVFIGAVLFIIFVLGLFTVIRLVDIALEHLQARIALTHILDWYRTLTPDSTLQLAFETNRSVTGAGNPALRFGRATAGLTTIAAMIATINAFIGAFSIGLLADRLGIVIGYVWLFGAAALVTLVGGFFIYQTWRLREVKQASRL